jgi:1-acyl-sn-glycerol-3-phosphate acyltransferase
MKSKSIEQAQSASLTVPKNLLRPFWITGAFALANAVLLTLQALSILARLPTTRWIPVAYHRIACRLIGVHVHVSGKPAADRPLLIVANHISWLDIPVIGCLLPVIFVAKQEIASLPVFGMIAKLGQSIFVDRQRKLHVKTVNHKMAQRLLGGDAVVLFAEGTSTNGEIVAPFHSALIGAAEYAIIMSNRACESVCIQPLSIAYLGKNREVAAFYGTKELLAHMAEVLRSGPVDVKVTWGDPIMCCEQDDRKEIAKTLEETVRQLALRPAEEDALSSLKVWA